MVCKGLYAAVLLPPFHFLIFFNELVDRLLQEDANRFILINCKMFQSFKALGIDSGGKCLFIAHVINVIIFISLIQVFFL